MATSAPSLAKRNAVARPIPRDPPVTSATRPANVSAIGLVPPPQLAASLADLRWQRRQVVADLFLIGRRPRVDLHSARYAEYVAVARLDDARLAVDLLGRFVGMRGKLICRQQRGQ